MICEHTAKIEITMTKRFRIIGELNSHELGLIQASQECVQVSFETEQMGSFDDDQVIVVKPARTPLDDLADFVEQSLRSPVGQHAVIDTSPQDLTDPEVEGLVNLGERFRGYGVTVHSSVSEFLDSMKSE